MTWETGSPSYPSNFSPYENLGLWDNQSMCEHSWLELRPGVHLLFQLLMINSQNDKDQASLTINAHVRESTADISLLGVNIDEHLVISKHISELWIKASQRVGVLSRLWNLIPTEAKLLLYKSSILPYLIHCHLIWHFCKASDARKVERVQERDLRIVYNTHSVEYSNLLNRVNLPSLQNRRLQDLVALMYKVKYLLFNTQCHCSLSALNHWLQS